MFLVSMFFSDFHNGIVVGDPIDHKVFLAHTFDNGNTWKEIIPDFKRPRADSGEAFFAASGTNIRLYRDSSYYMVSGGVRSRLISKKNMINLPFQTGKE